MFKSEFYKQIAVTLLSLIVLCSTLSFSVHKHFCGAFLVDVSIITASDGCGMEMDDSCDISQEKNCCHDIVEIVKGQDDLKHQTYTIDLTQELFIVEQRHYYSLITGDSQVNHPFIAYSPPLVIRDIPVLHQSFLL